MNTGADLKKLPPDELNRDDMYGAIIKKDPAYEGVFFAAVKTTGIFCRPTCSAKKPKPENVVYYYDLSGAIRDGYRPCKMCQPENRPGKTPPEIRSLLDQCHAVPAKRITDQELRLKGLDPAAVRRGFQNHFGMTFHAYQRLHRLNHAFAAPLSGSHTGETPPKGRDESDSGFTDLLSRYGKLVPKNDRSGQVITVERLETPLGLMLVGAVSEGICLLEFFERRMLERELRFLVSHFKAPVIPGKNPHLDSLRNQLTAYFAGTLQQFDLPLVTPGTVFQQRVWQELCRIPYGSVRSYRDQAAALGTPEAVRAVANANGMNRITIVIPCHRIIGSNGELRGYGGGVWRKKRLLDLEQSTVA